MPSSQHAVYRIEYRSRKGAMPDFSKTWRGDLTPYITKESANYIGNDSYDEVLLVAGTQEANMVFAILRKTGFTPKMTKIGRPSLPFPGTYHKVPERLTRFGEQSEPTVRR